MYKRFLKITISLFFVAILISCATALPDVRINKAEKEGRIYLGMTFEEVVSIVGFKPGIYDVWVSGRDSLGSYQLWGVNARGGGNLFRTYWFKFRDGKLVEYWSQ